MFTAESDSERILKMFNICQSYGQLSTGCFFLWNAVYMLLHIFQDY